MRHVEAIIEAFSVRWVMARGCDGARRAPRPHRSARHARNGAAAWQGLNGGGHKPVDAACERAAFKARGPGRSGQADFASRLQAVPPRDAAPRPVTFAFLMVTPERSA